MKASIATLLDTTAPAVRSLAGKKVLISVPTGFQLRQFVHSGVVDRLLKLGCKLVIVSPNGSGEGFTASINGPGISFRVLNPVEGPFLRRYFQARQHFVKRYASSETLHQKMKALRSRYPIFARFASLARTAMTWSPALRRATLRYEHLLLRHPDADRLLQEAKPDLVLLGSPGYMLSDAVLLHTAKRSGIPVVVAVLSWDNLSTKGLINPEPDQMLVWSEHMRQEAIELHGFDKRRIVVTGDLVHDAFANAERFGTRRQNLTALGLDPSRKLIFYGTNHAGQFPDEVEVVKQVAQWVERDQLGEACQLLVRLHPQAVRGPYKVDTDAYMRLSSERVIIEFPPVQQSHMQWELPKSDLEHLIRVLRDADVVINSGSTISLDAAILDRPVISVAFDPTPDKPFHQSVRRFYSLTHMLHVTRLGAIRTVESLDQLRDGIVQYLENPALDRDGRRRAIEQQFGRVDGLSAERTIESVANSLVARS